MDKLRKEKEAENKRAFQTHQQIMRENLQKHMETKSSDEDQRIAETVQKQLAKRDVSTQFADKILKEKHLMQAEQREKQLKYMEATRDIYTHTVEQMAELEHRKRCSEEMDKEMLKQRIIQDQKVRWASTSSPWFSC